VTDLPAAFDNRVTRDLGVCQVAGRIDPIRPVADIIADTVREFAATVARLQG